MKFIDEKLVPQIERGYVELKYIEYKTQMGSYKAPDRLLELLEFASVTVLGSRAFDEYSPPEIQNRLTSEYLKLFGSSSNGEALMSKAIKWAWPPIEGTRVEFDSNELLESVSALCKLVEAQPDDAAVNNIIQHHENEEPDEADLTYLGKELKRLGALRTSLLKATDQLSASKASSILKGYDEQCKT